MQTAQTLKQKVIKYHHNNRPHIKREGGGWWRRICQMLKVVLKRWDLSRLWNERSESEFGMARRWPSFSPPSPRGGRRAEGSPPSSQKGTDVYHAVVKIP
jgi:hypothetical protein